MITFTLESMLFELYDCATGERRTAHTLDVENLSDNGYDFYSQLDAKTFRTTMNRLWRRERQNSIKPSDRHDCVDLPQSRGFKSREHEIKVLELMQRGDDKGCTVTQPHVNRRQATIEWSRDSQKSPRETKGEKARTKWAKEQMELFKPHPSPSPDPEVVKKVIIKNKLQRKKRVS